jgi:4-hydroxythreonine-4-phosphate dehydrogenase
MSRGVKIAVTIGDPAGVGPEVTVKALRFLTAGQRARLVIFGDRPVLRAAGFTGEIADTAAVEAGVITGGRFPVGRLDPLSGRAALAYLHCAVDALRAGRVGALVTAPVSKAAITRAGLAFSGHTGYLAEVFGVSEPGMLFTARRFNLLLLTEHIPLREVPGAVTGGLLYRKVILARDFLVKKFRIENPSVLVCGLNPHAGEDGVLGCEEREIMAPALARLRRAGVNVSGPVPADSAVNVYRAQQCHLLVSCYHDQVLPAFKAVNFFRGVNVTVGLPFVRTSPGHGTAFDLAGRGMAVHTGMLAAIRLAFRLSA